MLVGSSSLFITSPCYKCQCVFMMFGTALGSMACTVIGSGISVGISLSTFYRNTPWEGYVLESKPYI